MNKNNVYIGLILIAVALYMLLSNLGIIPPHLLSNVLWIAICGTIIVKGIVRRNFYAIFIPAGLLFCKFGYLIPNDSVANMSNAKTMVVAVLFAIGFHSIFGRRERTYYDADYEYNYHEHGHHAAGDSESTVDSEYIRCSNNFATASKYVNSTNFIHGDIANNFGTFNGYFDNAVLAKNRATLDVENNFGQTNLYLPKTWRVELREDCSFGSVRQHGQGNADMDAPYLRIDAESNFGEINIYFI